MKADILGKIFLAGGIMAIVFAGIGSSGKDLWLASTQWLLVSSVLLLLAVYFKLERKK